MKIELREFVMETFIVEVPDDTPDDDVAADVEALRVQYTGERTSELQSTDWDYATENHDDIAYLLIRFRSDNPGFDSWLSYHDRDCWTAYVKGTFYTRDRLYSYPLWRAGDEAHNPREMAAFMKAGEV